MPNNIVQLEMEKIKLEAQRLEAQQQKEWVRLTWGLIGLVLFLCLFAYFYRKGFGCR
jgi:hypothetical protein